MNEVDEGVDERLRCLLSALEESFPRHAPGCNIQIGKLHPHCHNNLNLSHIR